MAESPSRFVCVYCNADVSDLRIICAECPEEFSFCPECFSAGAEIGGHKRTHSYRVQSRDPPLFLLDSWRGSEEIELLQTVRRFAYMDWATAARLMKPRSAKEVENHYVKIYLHGTIGKATHPLYQSNFEFQIEDLSHPVVKSEKETFDSSSLQKETCKKIKYNPKIGYYKEPYDPEAEVDVVKITDSCTKEQNGIHNSLEAACINMYRSRLKRRSAVECLVQDYKLIKSYNDSQSSPDCDEKEREIRDAMKVFCRFLKPEVHEALVQCRLKEKSLKTQFRQLKEKLILPTSSTQNSNKPEVTKAKQNKSEENESLSALKFSPLPDAVPEKKTRSPFTATSTNNSRKRKFQQDLYAENSKNLLTRAEKKLCSNLSLDPSSYLALKVVLLRERNVGEKELKKLVSKDFATHGKTVKKVAGFMAKNGWIRAG